MKIAFLYGGFSLGNRPFDFDRLYDDPRGLTGSEISCVEHARSMSERGHDVMLLVGQPMAEREWRGIRVRQLDDPRVVDDCDVVYSWNEPNLLREVAPGILRACNQQLNDFGYCKPGWEDHVDLMTSPSANHLEYLKKQAPGVRSWAVMPNGCDPTQYRGGCRIPGRVIWASSADRGLHLLLESWPRIKESVPHATLKCFYNFQPAHFDDYEATGQNVHPDLLEIAQRKRYIRYAMSKLSGERWGVEHVGSVSRDRMRCEFEQAEVLAYPCETIRYTEGFSVTTMEACASGCLPVISDVDAMGSIYGGTAPVVQLSSNRFDETMKLWFAQLVMLGLSDPRWREERAAACKSLAENHAWPVLAERLEGILEKSLAEKRGKPGRMCPRQVDLAPA